MIIDFHTHIFPDLLAKRAIPTLYEKSNLVPNHDGTASGLEIAMDKSGIDKAVVLSIATKPSQENSVNTFAISLLDNPRIIPFGSVFPGSDSWSEQLDRLKEAGVKGIKLHPEYQGFYIDSDDALKIYEKCAKLGLVVHFHSGEDEAYSPPAHATPERVNRICTLMPDTKFVAAHFGGYNMWDEFAEKLEAHPNLWIDTSMSRTRNLIKDSTALKLINNIGIDHILFGSDSPWENQSDSINGILGLGLTDEQKEKIFSENAIKLLQL